MRRFALSSLLLFAALAAGLSHAQAETRYVTDIVEVPMRSGESNRYRIIKMFPSGTALDILGVNRESGYARVRAPDGTQGYILNDQLQPDPAARNRLAEMEARLAELQQEPDALGAQLAALQRDHAGVTSEFGRLKREKELLEQELAAIRQASANVVEVTNDRERLRLQVSELTRENADLKQRNLDLGSQTNQRWFMIGSGVVVAGILIGLILPHLRFRRRRSSWGSL